MAFTFKLLKEGELVRRIGGSDGMVDTWGIAFSAGVPTKLAVMNALKAHLTDLTWWDSKDGLPLAEARVAKIPGDTARAYARVTYGVIGGSGGYYLPLVFSSITHRKETIRLPIIQQSGIASTKLAIRELPKLRTVSVYRFNTRIDQGDAIAHREEIRTHRNQLRAIDGSLFELVDGRVYRMASGEHRGELIFEQRAVVPGYAPGEIGNDVLIPALLEHQEYEVDIDAPLITPIAATTLYGPPMDSGTFSWMDFNV